MATRSVTVDRDFRAATTLPETWDEDTRSIELVFSTGARATKFDKRRGIPWIEDLPLRGMDVSELNVGAHVLRVHGLDPKTGEGLDAVIGSVVPGTVRVVSDTDARARITLSRAPSKADVVQDIRDGAIRQPGRELDGGLTGEPGEPSPPAAGSFPRSSSPGHGRHRHRVRDDRV